MGAEWVPIAVAFAGGTALAKLIDVLYDRWKGVTDRRRSEVDRIAKQLNDAQRRARIAVEHAHEVRVIALRAGVPSSEMPVLSFTEKEDTE